MTDADSRRTRRPALPLHAGHLLTLGARVTMFALLLGGLLSAALLSAAGKRAS